MFKKLLKGMVIGGAALTIAASAQAGTINVNLYGASAQYEFWTAAAPEFLISQGCDSADVASAKNTAQKATHKRDAGIAVCFGGDPIQGRTGGGINGDTVAIRYTSEASYDGVRAVMADPNYTTECGDGALRKQADAATATFPAYPAVGSSITTLTCQDVHIGASDVAATTFGQYSEGQKLGNNGGGYITQSVYFPDDLQDPEANDYQVDRPIVVPFGFFAHTSVPFNNMSRLMATSIFSGQVTNWNEFDPSLASLPMVVCLRHAGSGTAATLDAAVMRGDASLLQVEALPGSFPVNLGIVPVTYFNNGSSDEVKCVGQLPGAVGYADADKCATGGCLATVKTMTYQGVAASSNAIKNGQYDFWSAQWLYSNEPAGATDDMIDNLVAYASDDANMPVSKAGYWASQDAMKWGKASDFVYPSQK
ncbi:MAG: substrate-binding domain-containing protein [Desulfobacula sp.]|nr:substrate-binding domain-containing protein [Desulfobacula sp.]